MSRAAGTLITTTKTDYVAPHFMPGYCGHCPTIKFDFAQTYGNITSKYFQDYRSNVLRSSKSNYSSGGHHPTYNTFNPELAINKRARCWDSCIVSPKYRMLNSDLSSRDALEKFYQSAQVHRNYYNDKSGTNYPVQYFQLPTPIEKVFQKRSCLYQHPVYINAYGKPDALPELQNKPPNLKIRKSCFDE
ncbi:protein FAM166C A [Octopus bimaculoides]|uniref:Ciliary microtubule inner protein 2C n=1 Tax=Octopus bimaculoides TaxID=37653 RepID=A0A0L8HBG6_OCTBM|nr:protein FAM166C A [Octopus bimaculoides]|eukprot:XP_014773701.1 PREDICTED: UPF0573 protein C2orf70 homolog A-like [Octopus bimaculoides]